MKKLGSGYGVYAFITWLLPGFLLLFVISLSDKAIEFNGETDNYDFTMLITIRADVIKHYDIYMDAVEEVRKYENGSVFASFAIRDNANNTKHRLKALILP